MKVENQQMNEDSGLFGGSNVYLCRGGVGRLAGRESRSLKIVATYPTMLRVMQVWGSPDGDGECVF